MGFQGLWVRRGMLKIDSKNLKKISKNTEKKKMYLKTIRVINSRSVKVTSYMSIFQVPCLFEAELHVKRA